MLKLWRFRSQQLTKMLYLTIPQTEAWDEQKQEFIDVKAQKLQLEHSLVSLSKWEAKWQKPFLGKSEKSLDELMDYVRCMTLTQNVKPEVYKFLTDNNVRELNRYIEAPMTATTFFEDEAKKLNRETITAEIIYYWMIALNIPFECQKWHLNRLLTLIRVCNIKNNPPKKRSTREIMRRNTALNKARRKRLGTRG